MKPYFLPAVTALIGFSLAWVVKPAGTTDSQPAETAQSAPVRTPSSGPGARPDTASGKRPTEVNAGDFPLVEQAENGPKGREEAKMLRLTEALDLAIDQQGAIIQLVEDVQASIDIDVSAIEDLTVRGSAIEEGLRQILTPEQFAKFQEIQIRERDNRTELRAQRILADTIEYIDLSPEQREEVMSRLRQKSKADLQTIPASATLLFDKSILPTGGKELSPDGVLLLAKMGEKVSMSDPQLVQETVVNQYKQELEDVLKCFDGILTSGQMGQYYASVAEKRENMERIRTSMAQQGKVAPPEMPDLPAEPEQSFRPSAEIVPYGDGEDDADDED